MKIKKPLYIFGIISIILIGSCTTNTETSPEIFEGEITAINAPKNAIVNQNVEIEIDFSGHNGCAQAYTIKAEKVGQTITLKALYSIPNTELACTQAFIPLQLNYTFFADLPGPYFFVSEMNPNIADTLVIY